MGYQNVFKRTEIKYLLKPEQRTRVLAAMEPYMALDQYGKTTIRNIYFDTDSYRLIRRSIEKPIYKEKLRIRSYRQAAADTPVYVELKKKYRDTVYKRRLALPREQAMQWLMGAQPMPEDTQIAREIEYFRQYYQGLSPKVFLSYDRMAYYCREGGDFRITFDENILFRQQALSLGLPPGGGSLLPDEFVLMEVKTSGGMPLWLTRVLTEEKIYKASFSKYGSAYQTAAFRKDLIKSEFEKQGGNTYV